MMFVPSELFAECELPRIPPPVDHVVCKFIFCYFFFFRIDEEVMTYLSTAAKRRIHRRTQKTWSSKTHEQ
jgi:hypothetical protein